MAVHANRFCRDDLRAANAAGYTGHGDLTQGSAPRHSGLTQDVTRGRRAARATRPHHTRLTWVMPKPEPRDNRRGAIAGLVIAAVILAVGLWLARDLTSQSK